MQAYKKYLFCAIALAVLWISMYAISKFYVMTFNAKLINAFGGDELVEWPMKTAKIAISMPALLFVAASASIILIYAAIKKNLDAFLFICCAIFSVWLFYISISMLFVLDYYVRTQYVL